MAAGQTDAPVPKPKTRKRPSRQGQTTEDERWAWGLSLPPRSV